MNTDKDRTQIKTEHRGRATENQSVFFCVYLWPSPVSARCLNSRLVEVPWRRAVDHGAELVEARSVARAVPCGRGGVPGDDAAKVRADGGSAVHHAALVAVDGDLAA